MSISRKRRISNTALRVIVGTLCGGILTGLSFAAFSTILLYGIAKEKTGGSPASGWVSAIASLEFMIGLPLGLLFGCLLSLANLGKAFGTVAGVVASIVPLWLWLIDEGLSESVFWPTFLKVTVPVAGGLVGFLTSFAIAKVSRRG